MAFNLTNPQKQAIDTEQFAGGAVSNICGSVLYQGEREITVLKTAAKDLFRLNDALRLRMIETEAGIMQRVLDDAEPEIPVLCFHNQSSFLEYAANYAKEPLQLFGPLCMINVIILPEQYGILVKLHHLISDAWTLSLVITQFYALANGRPVTAHSYLDYVSEEKKYYESPRFEKDRNFFIEQFQQSGGDILLPETQPCSFSADRKTFVIERSKAQRIKDYLQNNNFSAFVLFVSILAVYMNRTNYNAESFYIGTTVLNRFGPNEKQTMGMFINTVPLLIRLTNESSFLDNLKTIKQSVFALLRHQRYNYRNVLADLRHGFDFSGRLFDIMINYQNTVVDLDSPFESLWHHNGTQAESLQIHIEDRDGDETYKIHYDYLTDKYSEKDIQAMHGHICNLLFDAIEHDEKKLYELALLSESEKQTVLYEFNGIHQPSNH